MAIKDFYIARLHVDFGVFQTPELNKKEYIKELFIFISQNPIWIKPSRGDFKISISDVEYIADGLLKGKLIKKFTKKVTIIEDEEKKTIKEEEIDKAVDYINFYYEMENFLFFIEEKKGIGLDRNHISSYLAKILKEGISKKDSIADVDITFLGSERDFIAQVFSLKKIYRANFVLYPTNPNQRRIYEEIDRDLHNSNVEKRQIIDKAIPEGSLNYTDENSSGYKYLKMIEDGYGRGKVKGINQDGENVELDSQEQAEKLPINTDEPEENIIDKIKQKAREIYLKFKP